MEYSFINICGCGHTGSSILARILGEHSKIYFVQLESGMYLANRYFRELEYRNQYIEACKNEKKSFILEKTPRHIWHVDYIRRKYQKTKFIITTRDGLEVITSLFNRTKDFDQSCSRYFDDSILSLRQIDMPDTYLVRYEELIDEPRLVLESILKWLGLPYEESILDYHLKPINWNLDNPYGDSSPNYHDILRKNQVNSPLEKPIKSWSEKLPGEYHDKILELFEKGQLGREIMDGMGYKSKY